VADHGGIRYEIGLFTDDANRKFDRRDMRRMLDSWKWR
jgi:hypothetical protein